MTLAIYWHRNDLRIHDNECLQIASAEYEQMIAVYIIDAAQYRMLSYGFRKTGLIRHQYLVDTLKVLREQYQTLGSNLLIRFGNPATVIADLVGKYKAEIVITQEEIASEEQLQDDLVEKAIAPHNATLRKVWGKSLYHKDDIPYTQSKIPLTSKAFRVNTTKATEPRALIENPTKIQSPDIKDWGDFPTKKEIGFTKEEIEQTSCTLYEGGEVEALQRLQYYTFDKQLLTAYKWTRNKSLGMDYSSKLSPYLALGSLSPRMIYHTVKKYEKEIKRNISTWWLIFEVVWRDFFIFKSWRIGSKMFYKKGIKNKDVEWSYNMDFFHRWKDGQTGIPFLDAHLLELKNTGFMSNRGRVNAASFFTRDYQLDWRMGAAWFEHSLIDYDVYANWMNWHTQAFDIYYTNPVHQSLKYDKNGDYILHWFPQLKSLPHKDYHAPWIHSKKELEKLGIKNYTPPVEIYSKWNRSIKNILNYQET